MGKKRQNFIEYLLLCLMGFFIALCIFGIIDGVLNN